VRQTAHRIISRTRTSQFQATAL